MLMIGLPVCAVVAAVGYLASRRVRTDDIVLGATPLGDPPDGTEEPSDEELMVGADPTGPGTVLFLILAPVIQIVIGTVGRMLVPDPSKADSVLSLVGAPLVALLTAALLACVVLGCQQHWSLDQPGRTVDHALPDVAVVVLASRSGDETTATARTGLDSTEGLGQLATTSTGTSWRVQPATGEPARAALVTGASGGAQAATTTVSTRGSSAGRITADICPAAVRQREGRARAAADGRCR